MSEEETICPYCQCPVEAEDEAGECQTCHSTYHLECWEENGGCAVYGCDDMAEVKKLDETEIPVSYWGQERKPCPRCGKEILAAAVRCRSCGAEFQSSRPMDSDEYHTQQIAKTKVAGAVKVVLVLFILCLLPCTCILGAGAMGGWWLFNRPVYRELPALQRALVVIGMAIGTIVFAGLIATSLVFGVLR